MTVITSSGTFATLLLGLTAIASKQRSFTLSAGARHALEGALIAFVISAALAIFTNVPRNYHEPKMSGLRNLLEGPWSDTEIAAMKRVARNRLDVLERAREINRQKGLALLVAIAAEAVAIAFLAWAMTEII